MGTRIAGFIWILASTPFYFSLQDSTGAAAADAKSPKRQYFDDDEPDAAAAGGATDGDGDVAIVQYEQIRKEFVLAKSQLLLDTARNVSTIGKYLRALRHSSIVSANYYKETLHFKHGDIKIFPFRKVHANSLDLSRIPNWRRAAGGEGLRPLGPIADCRELQICK